MDSDSETRKFPPSPPLFPEKQEASSEKNEDLNIHLKDDQQKLGAPNQVRPPRPQFKGKPASMAEFEALMGIRSAANGKVKAKVDISSKKNSNDNRSPNIESLQKSKRKSTPIQKKLLVPKTPKQLKTVKEEGE